MQAVSASHKAYRRVTVETASQEKLIVMLFNGAIQRAEEGKRAIANNDFAIAHNSLLRAQDIISELRSALDMGAGEIAENLDRIYEFFHYQLVQANIQKDSAPIDECLNLMIVIRDTWQELFDNLSRDKSPAPAPRIDPHGAAVMNIEG